VCALFARALSQENSDLAWLGVVGWLGDGQDEKGLNLEVREWATASGNLKGDGKKGYSLQTEDRRFYKLPEIVDAVNALGAYDFFSGGPDYALKGLQSGNIEGLLQLSQRSKEKYQLAFGGVDEVSIISDPEAPIQWFELGEKFREFGVKTVGLVCEQLIASRRVDNEKYLVGFQSVPDYIPGLGPIALDQVKVSMRLPVGISNEVRSGRMLSLDKLLPEAAEKIGGFVDACHPHAAAVSIAKGDEMRLIQELKTALKRL
jgi:hypothetical protein